jgi:hypothetical protein
VTQGQPGNRRIIRRFLRYWYQRPFWLVVLVLAAVAAGRVALTPVVDDAARATLARLPHLRVSYRDLSLFSFPPSAVFTDVVAEDVDGQQVLSVPRFEIHLSWRDVLRGLGAGAWPYPAPHVRLRAVRPWLQLRSPEPAAVADQVHAMLDGLPAFHVDVVAIEKARVSVLGRAGTEGPDCVRDFNTAFQNVDLGAAAVPSPLGEEPPHMPAITRGEVKVPQICRRLAGTAAPAQTLSTASGALVTSSLDSPEPGAR